MSEPELHIESFGSFIERERTNYGASKASNEFASAFSQLDRYLRFLRIIKNRHDDLEERYVVSFERVMDTAKSHSDDDQPYTDSERAERAQLYDESERLVLEMESFYHFAYVALGKAALIMEWYFGGCKGYQL